MDGPIPSGECCRCAEKKSFDIYIYQGRVLCGDCRYYVRTGQLPVYGQRPTQGRVEPSWRNNSNPGNENAVRALEDGRE